MHRDQGLVDVEDSDITLRRQIGPDEFLDNCDGMRPGHRIDVMENNADRVYVAERQGRPGHLLLRLAFFAPLLFAARYQAEAEKFLPYAVFVNLHITLLRSEERRVGKESRYRASP